VSMRMTYIYICVCIYIYMYLYVHICSEYFQVLTNFESVFNE